MNTLFCMSSFWMLFWYFLTNHLFVCVPIYSSLFHDVIYSLISYCVYGKLFVILQIHFEAFEFYILYSTLLPTNISNHCIVDKYPVTQV